MHQDANKLQLDNKSNDRGWTSRVFYRVFDCKLNWHNKANRGELVFAKVLHAIQKTWFYWLMVTGMRLIPIRFS